MLTTINRTQMTRIRRIYADFYKSEAKFVIHFTKSVIISVICVPLCLITLKVTKNFRFIKNHI
jgi:hypothetical protein